MIPIYYRRLDPERLLTYSEILTRRVKERFPTRDLATVCEEIYQMTKEAQEDIKKIAQPNLYLRSGLAVFILLTLFLFVTGLARLNLNIRNADLFEVVSLLEAGIQDLIFIGAGFYFLTSIEKRLKRRRTLMRLNQLRALAHVIDMHQLTKEPEMVLKTQEKTESSPTRELEGFLLERYLDYCSEMLSIIGKVAALYVQDFDDEVVLAAVNQIEAMTTSLSRKVWQKIMIIHQLGM